MFRKKPKPERYSLTIESLGNETFRFVPSWPECKTEQERHMAVERMVELYGLLFKGGMNDSILNTTLAHGKHVGEEDVAGSIVAISEQFLPKVNSGTELLVDPEEVFGRHD